MFTHCYIEKRVGTCIFIYVYTNNAFPYNVAGNSDKIFGASLKAISIAISHDQMNAFINTLIDFAFHGML